MTTQAHSGPTYPGQAHQAQPQRGGTAHPGTPALLRTLNDRTALALLLDHGVLTRNRIGELSGLSKPTASQMVQRLEAAGLIEAVGEVSAGRGPNAVGYGVRAGRVLGVAIDIAAGVIRSTIVDATGAEHPLYEQAMPQGERENAAQADVRAALEGACAVSGMDPAAVAVVLIGIQGSVDPASDELLFAESLPSWPTSGVRALLERELGCAVLIDNDVKLAAVAERRHGAGSLTGGFALLWMGDGLGLAVDLAGVVHRGAAGGAGEIGYLPVPRSAALIDDSAEDLQDLVGGEAVVGLARAAGVTGTSPEEVIAAIATHPAKGEVLDKLAVRIAIGIVPVLALLDPEVVVLGGPTGSVGGEELAERVRAEVAATSHWNPRVIATEVAEHPVLRGAREVLMHEVRERLFAELGAQA